MIQPVTKLAGDVLSFSSGILDIRLSLSPQSGILDEFYRGYDAAFVLPNEKEELGGFRECLALNYGAENARLVAEYGPFFEAVMIASDRDAPEQAIGGANFVCYPLIERGRPVVAMNLNYIYVSGAQRRRGYLAILLQAVRIAARRLCNSAGEIPVLIFLEQNDPIRMDADAYALDTQHSGLDQKQRIGIWARQGARIVDFPYVQPALSPDQEPDDTLVYALIGAPGPEISACLLRDHLTRFFGISVLKGRAISDDPAAAAQIAVLSRQCGTGDTIALLDPSRWAAKGSVGNATSLREALREYGS